MTQNRLVSEETYSILLNLNLTLEIWALQEILHSIKLVLFSKELFFLYIYAVYILYAEFCFSIATLECLKS